MKEISLSAQAAVARELGATDRRDRLAGRAVALATAAATLVAVACVLLPERVPFQDLPVRAVFSARVGAALLGTDPFMAATLWPVHGWLYELLAWPLSLLVGPLAATRLLLALGVAGVPVSVALLFRRLDLPASGAAFTAPFLLSVPVVMGFVPFVLSVPLAVISLAEMLAVSARPTARRLCGVALLFLATYGMHAFGYMAAALAGGAAVLVRVGVRQAWPALLTAVPAGLLLVASALLGEGAEGLQWGPGPLGRLAQGADRVADVLMASLDRTVALTALAALLAASALSMGRRGSRAWLAGTVAAAVLLGLWLGLPEHAARPPIFQLADRFLWPLVLILPVALGVALRGVRQWLLAVPLALAVLLHAAALSELLAFGAHAGPVERLLERVPDGETVLGAIIYSADVRSPLSGVLIAHAPFHYELEGRGRVIAPYGHSYMPVHYRDAIEKTFVRGQVERLVRANAGRVGWVVTDAPETMLGSSLAGEGYRLEPRAEDAGIRLLRVVRSQ